MRTRWKEKTIYISKEENEMLIKKSKEANLTQSEYVRKLVRDYEPIKTDITILTRHSKAIDQINNALGKLARQAYMYDYIDSLAVKKQIEHMNFIMDDIMFNLEKQ